MHNNALIIFARNPRLGKVKSRLAKTVGDKRALEIYFQLLQHTKQIALAADADRYLYFTQPPVAAEKWSEKKFTNLVQHGSDLGERMTNALAATLEKGYQKVVIIGTDCFQLETDHLQQAFLALNDSDIVIGPAEDGGYYLIGTKKDNKHLFEGIAWSTNEVLRQTVEKARNYHLKWHLLPQLSDVDEENDLPACNVK